MARISIVGTGMNLPGGGLNPNPNDSITGTLADESIIGLLGDDTLRGGGGSDLLRGGFGDDALIGGAGDDILIGVGGTKGVGERDALTGGTGSDKYVLGSAKQAYYVGGGNADFALAKGYDPSEDTLQLHGDVSDYTFGLNAGGTSVVISFVDGGGDDMIARIAGVNDIAAVMDSVRYVG